MAREIQHPIPAGDEEVLRKRFMDKVRIDDETGCWHWKAYLRPSSRHGPQMRYRGEVVQAHLVALSLAGRHKADDQIWVRTCGSFDCVGEAHRKAVSEVEAGRRKWARQHGPEAEKHCIHGHEWSDENTRLQKWHSARGLVRRCRACDRERWHRRKAALRQAKETAAQSQ